MPPVIQLSIFFPLQPFFYMPDILPLWLHFSCFFVIISLFCWFPVMEAIVLWVFFFSFYVFPLFCSPLFCSPSFPPWISVWLLFARVSTLDFCFHSPLHSRHLTVCTQRCSHPLPRSHLTDPCHYWPSNARLQRRRWSHTLRPPWRCGLPGLHPLHQADLAPSCWTAWRWCHLLGLLQPGGQ